MSSPTTLPAEPLQPDPDRAASARLDSAGAGKILRLLHTLVAYGRNLVEKLREEDDPDDLPWYAFLTGIFGTTNPALITVTIIRGLLRAAALQARLSKRVALLLPLPVQEDRFANRIDAGRQPSPPKPRVPSWLTPQGWLAGDPSLDREPTPEEEMFAEIVEEDRDRPIGPILLDICLDLGIVPEQMDPATWDELRHAISLYGGDPAGLAGAGRKTPDLFQEHSAIGTLGPGDSPPIPVAGQSTFAYPPWPGPSPQSPVPASTGPP